MPTLGQGTRQDSGGLWFPSGMAKREESAMCLQMLAELLFERSVGRAWVQSLSYKAAGSMGEMAPHSATALRPQRECIILGQEKLC